MRDPPRAVDLAQPDRRAEPQGIAKMVETVAEGDVTADGDGQITDLIGDGAAWAAGEPGAQRPGVAGLRPGVNQRWREVELHDLRCGGGDEPLGVAFPHGSRPVSYYRPDLVLICRWTAGAGHDGASCLLAAASVIRRCRR